MSHCKEEIKLQGNNKQIDLFEYTKHKGGRSAACSSRSLSTICSRDRQHSSRLERHLRGYRFPGSGRTPCSRRGLRHSCSRRCLIWQASDSCVTAAPVPRAMKCCTHSLPPPLRCTFAPLVSIVDRGSSNSTVKLQENGHEPMLHTRFQYSPPLQCRFALPFVLNC